MKRAIFHPEAKEEMAAASAYYQEQRRGLGRDFQKRVRAGVRRIQRNPRAFPSYGTSDLRKYVVQRFPFTIFYLELEKTIWIAAVAHQKREPGYWLNRSIDDK
jgi:toxin ParE1/3/4